MGLRADEVVEMRNGEKFVGRLSGITSNHVVLESQTAGVLRIDRAKISVIRLAPETGVSSPVINTTAEKTLAPGSLPSLSGISTNSAVTGVHQQLLQNATPEATKQFQEMAAALLGGKLTVSDLKAQARALTAQARQMQSEMGEEGGSAMEGYLRILENFVADKPLNNAPEAKPAEKK